MSESFQDAAVTIIPVSGLPEVNEGDDLSSLLGMAITSLQDGDIVVVTHKIVSKAEGQLVDLTMVNPSALAASWADVWGKDARQVEVVLQQARRIIRMHHGLIVAETRHGFICANAGVDASNSHPDHVVLLPVEPDASARRIRHALIGRFFDGDESRKLGVIITDSFGRPWRNGIVNIAIGSAGISPFADYRGQHDPTGYELRASVMAVADELASAAELVMHKTHRVPVAIIRNYEWSATEGSAADLVMAEERNLFR